MYVVTQLDVAAEVRASCDEADRVATDKRAQHVDKVGVVDLRLLCSHKENQRIMNPAEVQMLLRFEKEREHYVVDRDPPYQVDNLLLNGVYLEDKTYRDKEIM